MQALADVFMDAPFVAGGWERALRLLARETGSAHGQLIGIGGPAVIPFNVITDVDPLGVQKFVEIDGGSPERNYRVAASRGPLQIVHEDDYAVVQPFLRDDVYNDFCRDYDIPHGIQTVLQQGGDFLIGLAVNRTAAEGPSSADQRAVFAAAVPHVLRAVRLQQAVEGQGTRLIAGSLESLTIAAFVLDCVGTVRAMTPAAQAEVASGARLQLRGARLAAANAGEQASFDNALGAALCPPYPDSALVLRGSPGSDCGPAALSICSVALDEDAFGFAPKALVVVRGRSRRAPPEPLLRAAFGLTPSEAAVAAQLALGLDREEIAALRGVSAATVHTQLKAIFEKAGVSREVELVLAIARLCRL